MITYNDYWVDNYLQHYGVLGMRWKKGRGTSGLGVYNSKKINKLNEKSNKRTARLKASEPSSIRNQKLIREATYKKALKANEKRESAVIAMEKALSKNTRPNGKNLSNRELLKQATRQLDNMSGIKRSRSNVHEYLRGSVLPYMYTPPTFLGGLYASGYRGYKKGAYIDDRNTFIKTGKTNPMLVDEKTNKLKRRDSKAFWLNQGINSRINKKGL